MTIPIILVAIVLVCIFIFLLPDDPDWKKEIGKSIICYQNYLYQQQLKRIADLAWQYFRGAKLKVLSQIPNYETSGNELENLRREFILTCLEYLKLDKDFYNLCKKKSDLDSLYVYFGREFDKFVLEFLS